MKTLLATFAVVAFATASASACPYSNKSASVDSTVTASISVPQTPISTPADAVEPADETVKEDKEG